MARKVSLRIDCLPGASEGSLSELVAVIGISSEGIPVVYRMTNMGMQDGKEDAGLDGVYSGSSARHSKNQEIPFLDLVAELIRTAMTWRVQNYQMLTRRASQELAALSPKSEDQA